MLHRRRFRETSLIVDFLTLARGRVGAVARGALRKGSRLGAALQPATELGVSFAGRGELLTLRAAEARGRTAMPAGRALYSLFYVNELVLKLTAAHDPNDELFRAYAAAMTALEDSDLLEAVLRRFEKQLLDALGLGLNLVAIADTGEPLEADALYTFVPEFGALRARPADVRAGAPRVHGRTLLALGADELLEGASLAEAKRLMRRVLAHHLDGRPLASRRLFEAGRTPRRRAPGTAPRQGPR